jgi:SAM-dependent methyltransferase
VERAVVLGRADRDERAHLVAYVEVPEQVRAQIVAELAAERVLQWEHVHDDERLADAEQVGDPTFDVSGWNDSYSGEAIPAEQMREWVDAMVARIGDTTDARVLEVGCGTGLLLFRLAPGARRYLGTDIAPSALENVTRVCAARPDQLGHVEVRRAEASGLGLGERDRFDMCILNSVVQYFPSAGYLRHVLSELVDHLVDGGRIFVGDVRDRALLRAFHASVLLTRAGPRTADHGGLALQLAERAAAETELCLDADWFRSLPGAIGRISDVRVALKRSVHANEMTDFRYDVTLHVGPREAGR